MKTNTLKTLNLALLATMLCASASQATDATVKNNEIVEASPENMNFMLLLAACDGKFHDLMSKHDMIMNEYAEHVSHETYADIKLHVQSMLRNLKALSLMFENLNMFQTVNHMELLPNAAFLNGSTTCNQIIDAINTIKSIAPDVQVAEFLELRDCAQLMTAEFLKKV